jgi:hypothetical protein
MINARSVLKRHASTVEITFLLVFGAMIRTVTTVCGLPTTNVCSITFCVACDMNISGPEFAYCDRCDAHVCNGCQAEAYTSPPISNCQCCGIGLCRRCSAPGNIMRVTFQNCSCCGLPWCCNDADCIEYCGSHDCTPPGEILYSARDARIGDNEANLSRACGKKHLASPKGQQFMCSWLKE